jgi:alpha-L-fucosidase
MTKTSVILLSLLILFACNANQDIKTQSKTYTADWESMKDYPVPTWFDDAKFGIFIHWGAYSVLGYKEGNRGYAEHTPKWIYQKPEHYYPVLQERFGAHPPEFGYKDIIARFTAEKWDPDAWAQLFADAGARYVVLTAEHHDGYALWDSDLTDWCATKVGPKRDLVGDLGTAVRAQGLKYAPSYHRERHTGFFARDMYAVESEPHPDIAAEIQRMPSAEDLYGPFNYDDAFIADYVARWKEIQEKYRPDFMWLDDIPIFYKADPQNPQVKKFLQACAGMIADYLNTAQEWGTDVYLNNKGGNQNWPVNLGCLEKDNMQVSSIGVKWENPATLATSYGYMEAEERTDAYRSSTKMIHLLCDVVSKNGNLLLNIGPKPDGTIPAGMQDRLLGIGKWLQINGEAIYGTRSWTTFGEGILPNEKNKDQLGRHTVNSTGVRYTRSQGGSTVYAILLEQPNEVTLKSFQGEAVKQVELIGSNATITWSANDDGLHVELPSKKPCDHAWVLKISQ